MNKEVLNVDNLNKFIENSDIMTLAKIWQFTSGTEYYYGQYTEEDYLIKFKTEFPGLLKCFELEVLEYRVKVIEDKSNDFYPFWKVDTIFPERLEINKKVEKKLLSYPKSIEKAEAWLYSTTYELNTVSSLEVLIYFKSQDKIIYNEDELTEFLRIKLCETILRDPGLNNNDEELLEKEKVYSLSLIEMTELFSKVNTKPFFLDFYDNEKEFSVMTFFRLVESFALKEFSPWINWYSEEMSSFYQYDYPDYYNRFYLFYACRSDLILEKVSSLGLEALLHKISLGDVETNKPWKEFTGEVDNESSKLIYDNRLITASILIFAWSRLQPRNLNIDVYYDSITLLFQSQLEDGSWPDTTSSSEGSVLSTSIAMIAFGVARPEGYKRYIEKAKLWLIDQLNEVGCWYLQGAPSSMINILCIEALKLADDDLKVTFNVDKTLKSITTEVKSKNEDYIIFCEGNPNGSKNNSFDAKCYHKIFSQEFPNAIFISIGSASEIENENNLTVKTVRKINPNHTIIKLVDKDDRSDEEIAELKSVGIKVLTERSLESYLLSDEMIKKLCSVSSHPEMYEQLIDSKDQAVENARLRGNPADDIKSAAGELINDIKEYLNLTQSGNNTNTFMRDTMAPLVTPDTETYKKLKQVIFEP